MKRLKTYGLRFVAFRSICLFFLPGLLCCERSSDEKIILKETRIEHLVLFKFRQDITLKEKQEVVRRFMALKNAKKDGVLYITSIEYGEQNSKEGVSKGYEIAFRVSFTSVEDRDYYVGKPFQSNPGTFDPNHDAFKDFVGPYLNSDNGVLVFDYKPTK